jgi:hypothetical protein
MLSVVTMVDLLGQLKRLQPDQVASFSARMAWEAIEQ